MTAKHEPLPVATTLFATGLSGRDHRGAGTSKADLPAETGGGGGGGVRVDGGQR